MYDNIITVIMYVPIPKAEYYKICDIRRRTDAWAAEQFCSNVGGGKKITKVTEFRRLVYTTCIFVTFVTVQWKLPRVSLGGQFIIRKMDTSQNSFAEKRTLQNSIYRHENFLYFLRIPLFKAFQIATFSNFCAK